MRTKRRFSSSCDYARVVKIPPGAQTMVIGNPLIADVTMLRNNQLMVITGKSFGTTNLIVLDVSGTQVGESTITVVHPNDKLVVYRGPHREVLRLQPRLHGRRRSRRRSRLYGRNDWPDKDA